MARFILLPYLTTNCSVYFEIDIFTHNDHGGCVQFSTDLTQKKLPYQISRLIFINILPPVVHSPYSYKLWLFQNSYVWNLFLEDGHLWSQKTAIILYIGRTLGNISANMQ